MAENLLPNGMISKSYHTHLNNHNILLNIHSKLEKFSVLNLISYIYCRLAEH